MKPMPIILSLMLLLGSGAAAQAQSFGDSEVAPKKSSGAEAFGLLLDENKSPKKPSAASESPNKLETTEDVAKALQDEKEKIRQEREDIFMPGGGREKLSAPTIDNSKRGGVTVVEQNAEGKTRSNSKIFLYMDNFGIAEAIGGMVTCDMRFIMITNLDQKLTSFDAKLVWPGITTVLSFANVLPNTPTAYNYTLMGDGCYTMDKIPNIIVNRCRIKGMSAAQCADKIVWLSNAK